MRVLRLPASAFSEVPLAESSRPLSLPPSGQHQGKPCSVTLPFVRSDIRRWVNGPGRARRDRKRLLYGFPVSHVDSLQLRVFHPTQFWARLGSVFEGTRDTLVAGSAYIQLSYGIGCSPSVILGGVPRSRLPAHSRSAGSC